MARSQKLNSSCIYFLNLGIIFSPDRPNIYSSDSEEGYDSDKEERGAKRLMKAKKLASDDEVYAGYTQINVKEI